MAIPKAMSGDAGAGVLKPIFANSSQMTVHVTQSYGSVFRGGQKRKYQVYDSTKGSFSVQTPVSSKISFVGKNSQNENCVVITFDETLGMFTKGAHLLISNLDVSGGVSSGYSGAAGYTL